MEKYTEKLLTEYLEREERKEESIKAFREMQSGGAYIASKFLLILLVLIIGYLILTRLL